MRRLNISNCDLMSNAPEEQPATKKMANKQNQPKEPVEVFIPKFDTGEPLRIGDIFHIGASRPLTALNFTISDSATYVKTRENGELIIEHPVSHKPIDSLETIKSDSELGANVYCKNIGIELRDNKENELQSLRQGIAVCESQIVEINGSNSSESILNDCLQQDSAEV